jgi:integrase/recombinase XerC
VRTAVRPQRRGTGARLNLPTRGVTWDEAVRDFLNEKRAENCSPATVDKIYAWVLLGRAKEFVAEEGFTSIDQVDAEAFRRFQQALMGTGLAIRSVHIHYRTMKTFLRYCLDRGLLQDAHVATVKGPKLPEEHPVGFTAEEERLLVRAAYQLSGRDGVMLDLMLRTGLRLSEVCNLTVDDIWDDKEVTVPFLRVRQGKGRKDRIVPLDSPRYALSKRLREYTAKERQKDTRLRWLFLSHRKQGTGHYAQMTPLAVYKLFRRLGDLTGIPKLHPHRCRHHFATRSLAAGVNPDALRRALGHTTMAMTQRYLSSTETDLLEEWTHRRD